MRTKWLNYLITIFMMVSLMACDKASEEIKNAKSPSETASAVDSSLQSLNKQQAEKTFSHMDSVVLAVNVGGEKFSGLDGHDYIADDVNIGGQVGFVETMKGSQDSLLYKSYRVGDISIKQPVDNGLYDIIFKFTEPQDIEIGDRVFDVLAENKVVINDLDVRLARDGNPRSALDRAVTDVEVTDGVLNIDFKASVKEPLLSAFIVRKKTKDSKDWKLLWADEFNYTGAPDATKWTHDLWPAKKVNDENQTYTDRLKNVRVENGNLIIEAFKEKFNNAEYTSGRIHTAGKGDLLYRKIDIRAKLPAGQGTWPAIWMLPSDPFKYATMCKTGDVWQGNDDECDAWPNSGEIDIMEYPGSAPSSATRGVFGGVHYWDTTLNRRVNPHDHIPVGAGEVETWHVYRLDWTDSGLTFYYDNQLIKSVPYSAAAMPFDRDFFITLTFQVGGSWPGSPIDPAPGATWEVDWIRVSDDGCLLVGGTFRSAIGVVFLTCRCEY